MATSGKHPDRIHPYEHAKRKYDNMVIAAGLDTDMILDARCINSYEVQLALLDSILAAELFIQTKKKIILAWAADIIEHLRDFAHIVSRWAKPHLL